MDVNVCSFWQFDDLAWEFFFALAGLYCIVRFTLTMSVLPQGELFAKKVSPVVSFRPQTKQKMDAISRTFC